MKNWPYFFTASIVNSHHLLNDDRYKFIITDSLRYLTSTDRIKVFGFVIMINHIHLLWQIRFTEAHHSVQRDFLKYTSQKMKADLTRTNPAYLQNFFVDSKDRSFQFWKRNAVKVELSTPHFFFQKLNYIHQNPVRAGICPAAADYYFSSAKFYETGIDNWGFLSHYYG